MTRLSSIEWCDHTFNIAWGCIKVSPGCENCYAATLAKRTGHDVWGPAKTTPRRVFGQKHWDEPLKWNAAAAADPTGGVCAEIPGRLVFCSSMADVFEDHPTIDAEREKLWPLIRATPHLTWQLLTKRPERIAANLPLDWGEDGYPNVWLGTSIESNDYLWRYDELAAVGAAVHFISVEPMLGEVWLRGRLAERYVTRDRFNDPWWVIVGGESGAGARPLNLAWVRKVQRDCAEYGVSVFVKQLGAVPMLDEDTWRAKPDRLLAAKNRNRVPLGYVPLQLHDAKGGEMSEWPEDLRVREFPTAAARAV